MYQNYKYGQYRQRESVLNTFTNNICIQKTQIVSIDLNIDILLSENRHFNKV